MCGRHSRAPGAREGVQDTGLAAGEHDTGRKLLQVGAESRGDLDQRPAAAAAWGGHVLVATGWGSLQQLSGARERPRQAAPRVLGIHPVGLLSPGALPLSSPSRLWDPGRLGTQAPVKCPWALRCRCPLGSSSRLVEHRGEGVSHHLQGSVPASVKSADREDRVAASQEQRPSPGLWESWLSLQNHHAGSTQRRCRFSATWPPRMGPESRRVPSVPRSQQSPRESLSCHEDKGLPPQEPPGCMVWWGPRASDPGAWGTW